MKVCTIITACTLSLIAAAVMAAPESSKRTNDVPHCVHGTGGPRKGWQHVKDCHLNCYLMEEADGDNNGNICQGKCTHSAFSKRWYYCRRKW
ncbi:hypothetical protein J3F84DRAFT_378422 [Trichoderma pleuroticola]